MLNPSLMLYSPNYSGGPGRHDRGDLQQDEEADLGPAGPCDLGAVEGAAMT